MPLFEVAILEKPTKKDSEDSGAQEKLVFGPKAVVARDSQGAVVVAVSDGQIKVNPDRMEVLVRPFSR